MSWCWKEKWEEVLFFLHLKVSYKWMVVRVKEGTEWGGGKWKCARTRMEESERGRERFFAFPPSKTLPLSLFVPSNLVPLKINYKKSRHFLSSSSSSNFFTRFLHENSPIPVLILLIEWGSFVIQPESSIDYIHTHSIHFSYKKKLLELKISQFVWIEGK